MEHDEKSTVEASIIEIYSTMSMDSDFKNIYDETTTGIARSYVDDIDISTTVTSATEEFEPTYKYGDSTQKYFKLKYLEEVFIDAAAKTIIQWKTSLMFFIILTLITLISYYRRKIIQLKTQIVLKNLGNSYNQSCSYPHSTNTYTPTNFPRHQPFHGSKIISRLSYSDSDYEPIRGSRTNLYAQTYNSSLHLYESTDELCNENIYVEIPTRKHSIVSIENKLNSNGNNSTTSGR